MLGKQLTVSPCFKVVSPQATKVFCDYTSHFAVLNVANHALKILTLERRSARSVINVKLTIPQSVFLREP
jgi:hypothetical protein